MNYSKITKSRCDLKVIVIYVYGMFINNMCDVLMKSNKLKKEPTEMHGYGFYLN